MLTGKVVGNVWATKKEPSLNGLKLLIVTLLSNNWIWVCRSEIMSICFALDSNFSPFSHYASEVMTKRATHIENWALAHAQV